MGQRDDADLVSAALAGGPEAFNPIVDRYRAEVFSVALARLRDFDDADDIAQQVFIDAFASLHTLRDPKRLAPWLRSATINRTIDLIRRRRDNVDLDEAGPRLISPLTPETEVVRHQTREQVLNAIGRLSKAQRETTTLFYLGDYALREIAAIQDIPVGTVKRRLHDARSRLKSEMLQIMEETLKTEAPGEDFSERVFHLLSRQYRASVASPRGWTDERGREPEISKPLREFGPDGIEGVARAMRHPQAVTRRFTLDSLIPWYLDDESLSTELREKILGLITDALKDPNKKVRSRAIFYLLSRLHLDEDYVRKKVIPLVHPLLHDPVTYSRNRAARWLIPWAADVQLEIAAAALADHPDSGPYPNYLAQLVKAVLKANKEDSSG